LFIVTSPTLYSEYQKEAGEIIFFLWQQTVYILSICHNRANI